MYCCVMLYQTELSQVMNESFHGMFIQQIWLSWLTLEKTLNVFPTVIETCVPIAIFLLLFHLT